LKKLLHAYVGNTISIVSAAKKLSGNLVFVGDDYIVMESSPDLIDVIRTDQIVALEGLGYDTFLAAVGRNRVAMSNDMAARAEHLAEAQA